MTEPNATDLEEKETAFDKCDPDCAAGPASGPVREGGGTTGAGNLSPNAASRTGGATGGVADPTGGDEHSSRSRNIQPDAK